MAENSKLITQSVGFTVADMARSQDFYTQILPFQKVSDQELSGKAFEQLTGLSAVTLRVVQLQLGDEVLELTEYSSKGNPIPADTRSNDRWFQHLAIVVSDMEKAHHHVQQRLAQNVSTQPQTLPDWNPDVAGIQAFYFQDSDGHFLELIQFPPDKGAAKWQQDRSLLRLSTVLPLLSIRHLFTPYSGDLAMTHATQSNSIPQSTGENPPTLTYWHVWTDEQGISHQSQCELTNFEQKSIAEGTAPQWNNRLLTSGANIMFTELSVNWVGEWHENPQPQWIVPLSGRWFVETMDGQRVEMGPGDVSFGGDQNTGPGLRRQHGTAQQLCLSF
jgi:catechol 2,3-dioxygenase-like lactoylglutathione lyase family enzyme